MRMLSVRVLPSDGGPVYWLSAYQPKFCPLASQCPMSPSFQEALAQQLGRHDCAETRHTGFSVVSATRG